MSSTKTKAHPHSHGLTEADYQPVKTLINEVARQQNLGNGVVTWQNAFTIFKTLERQFGMPGEQRDRYAFLSIISELRGVGYRLLVQMGDDASEICGHIKTSVESFKACLEYLEVADRMMFLENEPETLDKLDAFFAAK